MIRKIDVKDYLLMNGHDLSWSCRHLIGLPSHMGNTEQIPYFVLEDDIDNAISSIYTQKDNVIESKDRVYFTKTSTIPRYKLKEYLDNNKINLDRTNRKEKATTYIINFNTIKYLKKELHSYEIGEECLKIPIHEYDRIVGIATKEAKKYVDLYNPLFVLTKDKNLINTCPNAEVIKIELVNAGWGFDKKTNIIDSVNLILEKINTAKIVFDETLLEQCTKEITIDNEIYESVRSMLNSKDEGNISLGIEMICNCNYIDSKHYILFLLNEFWNGPIKRVVKTTNFTNCLKYFQQYKNVYANHWQLLADQLLKENPIDEHRNMIKNYIINRINATSSYRGASFKIEDVKIS